MKKDRFRKILFFSLFFINIIVWTLYFSGIERELSINFFNVGNGDGILIETPERFRIVVDGGPSDIILDEMGLLDPFLEKRIDLLILTHPHEDHVFGALEVFKKYDVESVLLSGVIYDNPAYKELLSIIKESNTDVFFAENGQVLNYGNVSVSVLYPFEATDGKKFSNINDSSIVFKVDYNNFSAIFLGDIEEKAGLEILKQGIDLSANVVKVSHQGAKNGAQNLPFFLERIDSQVAVISVGDNSFGHPVVKTIDRLNNYGVDTYRTDEEGNIVVISDGERFWVKTEY